MSVCDTYKTMKQVFSTGQLSFISSVYWFDAAHLFRSANVKTFILSEYRDSNCETCCNICCTNVKYICMLLNITKT